MSLTGVLKMGCLCCKRCYEVEEERKPLLEGATVNISYTYLVVCSDCETSWLLLHADCGFACESNNFSLHAFIQLIEFF